MSVLVRILFILLLPWCQNVLAEQIDYVLKPRENQPIIGFKEALRRSIKLHESIKQAEQKNIIARSEYFKSFSHLLPSLSAKAAHDIMAHDDKVRFSLGLSLPLFDAKNIFTVRARREETVVARDSYERDQANLIYDVAQAYFAALIALAHMEVAQEEYNLYKRQASNMERLSALSNVRASLLHKITYQMERSLIEYRKKQLDHQQKLGVLGAKIFVDEEFLVEHVEVSLGHLANNEEELFGIAQNSPDIQILKRELEATSFMLLAERLDFFPKLNASMESGLLLPKPAPIRLGDDVSMRAFINLELPLFSGGETLAAIRGRAAQRRVHELALSQKLREKRLTLNGLHRQINDFDDIKAAAERAFVSAGLAQESAERMFKAGEATDSGRELIEAIGNYVQAKNLRIESIYNLEGARVRLLLATGTIKKLLE